jgi:2-keto-3-deoxy-6-phosphogluconate aldolase
MNISELLCTNPVLPLVQADSPAIAAGASRALAAGGLKVAEAVEIERAARGTR